MLRNVLLKTLRDNRRSLLWWSVGVVAYNLMILAFYPSFREFPGLEELFKQVPEGLMAAFVGQITDFRAPETFLKSELLFLVAPMLFIAFTSGLGSGAIAGEEGRGTLNLLLAHPVPRWQVVVQKFLAMVMATIAVGVAFWAGLAVGALAVDMGIGLWRLAQATISLVMLGVAFGTIALALGCATGNRGVSWALTGALALGTYLLNALGPQVNALNPLYKLSPFYWYMGNDPLVQGLSPLHVASLLGLALAVLAVGLLAFQRRDIAV